MGALADRSAALVAILAAAAMALSLAAAGGSVLPGDVAIARAIQGLPGWADLPFASVNWLGLAPVSIAAAMLIAAGFAAFRQPGAALLVALAPLAWVANAMLKPLLASPRPLPTLVDVQHIADGFGFPSGHVMGVTVMAILVAVAVRTTWSARAGRLAIVAAILVSFLTGLARIDAGAHWPSDVLGAWLWGALLALGIVRLHAALMAFAYERSFTAIDTVSARMQAIPAVGVNGATAAHGSSTHDEYEDRPRRPIGRRH